MSRALISKGIWLAAAAVAVVALLFYFKGTGKKQENTPESLHDRAAEAAVHHEVPPASDTGADSAAAATMAGTESRVPGPRNLQELVQMAQNSPVKEPAETLYANMVDSELAGDTFRIPAPGITYRLLLTPGEQDILVEVQDDGVLEGDANPVARLTGPGGRLTAQARTKDGAIEVSLPARSIAAGTYIMDLNPHQPRTSRQRRFILVIDKARSEK